MGESLPANNPNGYIGFVLLVYDVERYTGDTPLESRRARSQRATFLPVHYEFPHDHVSNVDPNWKPYP